MKDAHDAPTLLATLERLRDVERRNRRDAALRRTLAVTSIAALVVAGWRIADRILGREPMPVTIAAALVAFVAGVGLAVTARRAAGRSEDEMARELDRRLGFADRAAAALAIVRGGLSSRLAGYVVDDAETTVADAATRIDAAFPAKAERRVTAPVRWLARAAAFVIVCAMLAELLAIGGPLHVLPGISTDAGTPTQAVPPAPDAPPGPDDTPRPGETKPPDPPEDAKDPVPEGDVHVAMKMTKDEYGEAEPVAATVSAAPTGDALSPQAYDVRVSVDGAEVDTGRIFVIGPASPAGDRAEFDLRKIPGLKLAKGEHVAVARLTTRTSHEEHASAPVKFRIRGPDDDKDQPKGDQQQKPEPKPEPKPQDPDPQEKKPPEDEPAAEAPPPPPPATEKHVLTPLFGEGETVKKKGLVLVLDPGGGADVPPPQRPLEEALPDAKRRAEEAVDRARLSGADKELVRRYFELLEELRK